MNISYSIQLRFDYKPPFFEFDPHYQAYYFGGGILQLCCRLAPAASDLQNQILKEEGDWLETYDSRLTSNHQKTFFKNSASKTCDFLYDFMWECHIFYPRGKSAQVKHDKAGRELLAPLWVRFGHS